MSARYTFVESEPCLWTVGFRVPYTETWEPESDHGSLDAAEDRMRWLNGTGRGYVYRRTEPLLWTVGFYSKYGRWEPVADHGSWEEASRDVVERNGS